MPGQAVEDLEARLRTAASGDGELGTRDITGLWARVGQGGIRATADELGVSPQALIEYLKAAALEQAGGGLADESRLRGGLRRLGGAAGQVFDCLRENWLELAIAVYIVFLAAGLWFN